MLVLLILLFGLVSQFWFQKDHLLVGVDTFLPFNLDNFLNEYFYIWSWKTAFGFADVVKLPFLVPLGILLKVYAFSHLPFSTLIFQKLLTYFLFAGSGLSLYFLFRISFPRSSSLARLVAALLYMFNFYTMFLFFALPYPLLFSYAFFPLVFALYIKWINEAAGIWRPLALSLVWFIFLTSSYMTPPYLLTHFFILLTFSTFWVLGGEGRKERLKKAVWFNVWLLIFWFLLNLFWLLPVIFSLEEQLTGFYHPLPEKIPTDLFTLNSVPVLEALRLRGYFGFTATYKGSPLSPWFDLYKNNLFFDVLSFVAPALALLGFVIRRKKEKAAIFFLFLTLLFIALAKGANPPLGVVNRFIFSLPLMSTMFRTVYQRFTGYIALGLAVLVGYTFDCLFETRFLKDVRIRAGLAATFVTLICGVYVLPLWNGDLFSSRGLIPARRVKIPDYYFQAAEWLDKQPEESNTLLLPFHRDGLAVNSWGQGRNGYGGVEPLPLLSQGRFGYGEFGRGLSAKLALGVISGRVNGSRFLSPFNFKYVLVKNDTNWEYIRGNADWIGNDQELVNDLVGGTSGLAKVKSFGPLDFYQIGDEYFAPHFYVPQKLVYVNGGFESFLEISDLESDDLRSSAYLGVEVGEDIDEIVVVGETVEDGCPEDELCYRFNIPDEGEYALWIEEKVEQPRFFSAGEQRLQFRVPAADNLLLVKEGEYAFPFSALILEWKYNTRYKISFDYQVEKGAKISVGLLEKKVKDGNERFFVVPVGEAEGIGTFAETVTAKYGVEEVALNIVAGSHLGKVRNIKVERVVEPKVLLKKVSDAGEELEEVPKITFVRVNPTKYQVKIEGAKKPFTLVFNETFHDGWRLYRDNQPVLAGHFLVNWYANAWHIKPEDVGGAENLELMVEFWPQRLFYIGLFASVITLLGCLGYLGHRR